MKVLCTDRGQPKLADSDGFRVQVTDINDNTPEFLQQEYVTNLTENNQVGDLIVQVTARDRDFGNNASLTYNLSMVTFDPGSRSHDAAFSIDSRTGRITAGESFDRETQTQVRFGRFGDIWGIWMVWGHLGGLGTKLVRLSRLGQNLITIEHMG